MFDNSKQWFNKNVDNTDSKILDSDEKIAELKHMIDNFNEINPGFNIAWDIHNDGKVTIYGLISPSNPTDKVGSVSFDNIDEALKYIEEKTQQ
jgi:hypothetical protein